jgi:inner membrane protein
MPSIGHLGVGLAGGRVARAPGRARQIVWLLLLVAAAYAPDVDVLAFRFGIPYGAPSGHRGAAHSLAVGVTVGLVIGALGWRLGVRPAVAICTAVLVAASHGILDTFTDGGRGIALWWPFSSERVFASWRPIPVSPLGLRIFSPRGLAVMAKEAVLFLPLFVVAFWPCGLKKRVR